MHLTHRSPFVIVFAVALAVLSPMPSADGDRLTIDDAEDSSGRLDIEFVGHGHRAVPETGRRLLRHRLRTYEAWNTALLSNGGTTLIEFRFNIDADEDDERRLTVDVYDGKLYALMDDTLSGRDIGFAKVWRPNRHTVAVEFPPRLLKRGLTDYTWYAFTGFQAPDHPECGQIDGHDWVCFDRAPHLGGIPHVLV